MSLFKWAKIPVAKPLARTQRLLATTSHRNRSEKSLKVKEQLATKDNIAELNNLIVIVRKGLGLSDTKFAKLLGVSTRMLRHYKTKKHIPSRKTARRILELERLTRNKVVVIRNKTTMLKPKMINIIYIS